MPRKPSDIELLEKKIREQKSLIRSLEKRLKKSTKGYRKHVMQEPLEPIPDETECPECSKGIIKEFNILGRIFVRCNVCLYKAKL